MSKEEKLVCGCGGKVCKHHSGIEGHYLACEKCHIRTPIFNTPEKEEQAIAAFRKATRADVKQGIQWISVKERLPKRGNYYLVYAPNNPIREVWFNSILKQFDFAKNYFSKTITHWAYLNHPPEEK